jgi:N-acetylmuramoyl-L-alanine amidase
MLCFQKQSAYLCGMLSGRFKITLHYTVIFILMLAALPALSQTARKAKQAEEQATPTFRFKTIVIDPGHGGKDPGAHGANSNEKTIALSIAKKLKEAINNEISGVDVIMTRSTDKFIELHKRADIANDNKANLFISIHCNSSPGEVGKAGECCFWYTVSTAKVSNWKPCAKMLPFLLKRITRKNITAMAKTRP